MTEERKMTNPKREDGERGGLAGAGDIYIVSVHTNMRLVGSINMD